MRKIMKSFIIATLTISLILISSGAYANPPDDMILEYDSTTSTLEVTITHPTLDPNTHYIYKVDISVNGELYLSEEYTSQPTSDIFTYSYIVIANANDEISVTAICNLFGSITRTLTVPSEDAPNPPTINGPLSGIPNQNYEYTFVTTDPNGDNVFYYIEWGDGSNSGWIGPYASGEEIKESHSWSKRGTYIISAKAKDTDENEGSINTLNVVIPKTKNVHSNIILEFLRIFLTRFPILKFLFF
jgi:hypothetical protein